MSFHQDYTKWERKTIPENCPVCQSAPMPEGMIDLCELQHTWLNSEPIECMKGACHITAKYHGIELDDLSDEELLGLMQDTQLYAKALKTVTGAVKINYEIHGNTMPHLHIHLYPRHIDDPFPGKPIDYTLKRANIYDEGEYGRFVRDMKREVDLLAEAQIRKTDKPNSHEHS